jgi:hypothetical protein
MRAAGRIFVLPIATLSTRKQKAMAIGRGWLHDRPLKRTNSLS